ncbi:ABC transporter permease, partial [Paenibacillus sp. TAF58]
MSMPMLRFLFRKMWNTRWLTLSTLLGLVMAVAFTTSIPMYADGSLKRVVAKSLEEKSEGLPAGSLLMRYQAVGTERAGLEELKDVNVYIQDEIPKDVGFPLQTYARSYSIKGAQLAPADGTKADPSKRRQMTLTTLNGLTDQVEWSIGQMASGQMQNGLLEAVVLEEALFRNDLHIGDVFSYSVSSASGSQLLKVKIVGSFKPKNETSAYWFQG